jgi:hypothetical protein
MKRSILLALAAALALPVGAAPTSPPNRGAAVNAPALAPKLHIRAFTIFSPACDRALQFRIEVQNLTSTPFEGNKSMSPTDGPELTISEIPAPHAAWRQALPAVGGGATVPITLTFVGKKTACPSDMCWEVTLSRAQMSRDLEFPEWDGKVAGICAKTSCNPHATKRTTPCTFEIYSPVR